MNGTPLSASVKINEFIGILSGKLLKLKNDISGTDSRSDKYIIIFLFICAMIFRLLFLGKQNLWMDEGVIFLEVSQNSIIDVYHMVLSEGGHLLPFYHSILYSFSKLFGFSEWVLRFPSALFGSVSIILTYHAGKIFFEKRTALAGALLLVFSPLHIWYSQEARMYSLWIMLVLLMIIFFIKAIERNKLSYWFLFALLSIMSLWTQFNTFFILSVLALYLLIFIKKHRNVFIKYTVCVLIGLLSYAPGFMIMLKQKKPGIGSHHFSSIFDFLYTIFIFNTGTSFGPPLDGIRFLLHNHGMRSLMIIIADYWFILVPAVLFIGILIFISAAALLNWNKGFDRLIKAVDELVHEQFITEEVIGQIGSGSYKPKYFQYRDFFSQKEFTDYLNRSRIIISHAGMGTIGQAVRASKPVIVVPRQASLGEHVDNHQMNTTRHMEAENKVIAVYDIGELKDKIKSADTFVPSQGLGATEIIKTVQDFIEAIASK